MDIPDGYIKIEWDSVFKGSDSNPYKIIAVVPEEELHKFCDRHCMITKYHEDIISENGWD